MNDSAFVVRLYCLAAAANCQCLLLHFSRAHQCNCLMSTLCTFCTFGVRSYVNIVRLSFHIDYFELILLLLPFPLLPIWRSCACFHVFYNSTNACEYVCFASKCELMCVCVYLCVCVRVSRLRVCDFVSVRVRFDDFLCLLLLSCSCRLYYKH